MVQVGVVRRQSLLQLTNLAAAAQGYLFRPGGAYTLAICRIALFICLYIHIVDGLAGSVFAQGGAVYLAASNIAAYNPKSLVWVFFPNAPPPAGLIDACVLIARFSTVMAIFGLLTRVSMTLSVLSLIFVASLSYSWEPLWSHPYNGELLGGIGFMFGPAGDTFSLDALISRFVLRKRMNLNRNVYWWPVILGQFGAATLYFGGFCAKWSGPDFHYDLFWVFSDNLRNSVVLPWLIWGEPFPWLVGLIASNPILWKAAAAGHLITQAMPILAVLSLTKPWIRLFEGAVYAFGVAMLIAVMGSWGNLPWLWLVPLFIDWEYFGRKIGLRFPYAGPPLSVPRRRQISVATFAVGFVLTNLVVIGFRLDDHGWNRMYPFSSMTFYSVVAARKPYAQHLSYPFVHGELIFNFVDGSTKKWFCYPHINSDYNTALTNITDANEKVKIQEGAIKAVLANVSKNQMISDCGSVVSVGGFTSIDYYASILEIPPYPDRARFDIGQRALIARYEADGNRSIAAGPIFCWTARSRSPAPEWMLTDMSCFSATILGSTIGRALHTVAGFLDWSALSYRQTVYRKGGLVPAHHSGSSAKW